MSPFWAGLDAPDPKPQGGSMLPSVVRTVAPLLVSYIVGGLAALGVAVPDDVRTWITGAIGTVIAAVYYAVVRRAEQRWPALSVLLGSRKQPTYAPLSPDGRAHVVTSVPPADDPATDPHTD